MIRAAVAALAALLLTGCTLAPRYVRPEAPVAQAYPRLAEDAQPALAAPRWRDFFPDPRLQRLIEAALAGNRDLRVAALNVEAARAAYRIRRADLLPAIDAGGSAVSQRVPASLSTTGDSRVVRQYGVDVGVTAFELDLFGRVRSLRAAALQEYLALDETRQAAELSLVAEVANAWLTLIADRELLQLSRRTLESQRNSLDLTRLRFESGVVSELELHQAEIAIRQAEVDIAAYTRRVSQDRNALALLLGGSLPEDLGRDDVPAEEDVGLTAQLLAQPLEPGLPAALLERRPDIRAAEHALQARNADIGAARAAFFPRISLTGSYGRAHTDLDGLFDGAQRSWSFAPQISLPLFAGGANRANLDVTQARRRIEVARYELAIQAAFRDVADALAARTTLGEQLVAQEALTHAAADTYRLAEMRYGSGVESFLNTLIAQRDHYAAQQALIALRLEQASNGIALYKALGGGWSGGD